MRKFIPLLLITGMNFNRVLFRCFLIYHEPSDHELDLLRHRIQERKAAVLVTLLRGQGELFIPATIFLGVPKHQPSVRLDEVMCEGEQVGDEIVNVIGARGGVELAVEFPGDVPLVCGLGDTLGAGPDAVGGIADDGVEPLTIAPRMLRKVAHQTGGKVQAVLLQVGMQGLAGGDLSLCSTSQLSTVNVTADGVRS